MATVFRVRPDVDQYQYFLPKYYEEVVAGMLEFDCKSRISNWSPPSMEMHDQNLLYGSFFQFSLTYWILNANTVEILGDYIYNAGELLPFRSTQQQYYILNVTNCIDCLDAEESEWFVDKVDGSRIYPTRYRFRIERMTNAPIFKIPETKRTEIFIHEGLLNPGVEFRHFVETHELAGLIFEELWRSDR